VGEAGEKKKGKEELQGAFFYCLPVVSILAIRQIGDAYFLPFFDDDTTSE